MSRNAWNAIGMAIVWAASLGYGWVWSGRAAWTLFFAWTALLLYAGVTLLLGLQGVRVERRSGQERCVSGQHAEIDVQVNVRSWLPLLWLLLEETWVHENTGRRFTFGKLVFPWYRKRLNLHYTMEALPRGVYRLERLEATTGDGFGLFQKQRVAPGGLTLIVLPKPRLFDEWSAWMGEEGARTLHSLFVPAAALPGTVRDYEQGDPWNRIHWRSTAKGSGWKSKQADPAAANTMTIVFDVSGFAPDERFEQAVGLAAGLIRHGAERGVALTLLDERFSGRRVKAGHIPQPRPEYERLAALRAGGDMSADDKRAQALRLMAAAGMPEETALVVIAGAPSGDWLEAAKSAAARRKQVLVVYMSERPTLSVAERQWKRELLGCGISVTAAAVRPKAEGGDCRAGA